MASIFLTLLFIPLFIHASCGSYVGENERKYNTLLEKIQFEGNIKLLKRYSRTVYKVGQDPQAEPVPEPENNSTSEQSETSTNKYRTINNTSAVPKTTERDERTTQEELIETNTTDSYPEPVGENTTDTSNSTATQVTPEPTEENNDSDETEVEPEPEDADPEDKFNTDPFVEPGPDWKLAKALWKEAWDFHVYFFGTVFAILGVYCVLTLIKLWNIEHMISKHYFITLQLLVILVCILRSTYLMVDAYNSLGTFPFGVDYFLYSTAFPCLTSLFSILFYSLLRATRVQIISKKVQKLWVLVLIIAVHFILSIATDIVVSVFTSASVMILICQAFFILWGSLMFVGYLVLFRKLYSGAVSRRKALNSLYAHKIKGAPQQSKHKYTLGLAVKVTFITAFFGVAIAGFELYGMFGVYGILKSNTKPDPWPWWTYHTIVRSLEVLMCVTFAYVASQPLRYQMKEDSGGKIYRYLLPCSMCCCPHKLNQSKTNESSASYDDGLSDSDL